MPQPAPGIALTDVVARLSGRTILSGLSLHLTERRIGIVGRNGSGKTTFLRLIAGLIAPDSGHITVEGIDPARDRKAMLRHLGILFQNPDHQILFPTVAEELTFGLRQQGLPATEAATRVRAALAAEGRSHWHDAHCHQLSQGQKQSLCLMAVLLMQPATILLDEPFAGLDLPAQTRLTRRFASLPQRLITISHDPAAVAATERVIWLEAGHLRADGPPGVVLPAFHTEMARLGEQDADTHLAG